VEKRLCLITITTFVRGTAAFTGRLFFNITFDWKLTLKMARDEIADADTSSLKIK
jgi:hypothetical protein